MGEEFKSDYISITGSSTDNLRLVVKTNQSFKSLTIYVAALSHSGRKSESLKVTLEVCGTELVEAIKDIIISSIQNLGDVEMKQDVFQHYIQSSSNLCPIDNYKLEYLNEKDQSNFIKLHTEHFAG